MQTFEAFLPARCVREPLVPPPPPRLRLAPVRIRVADPVRAHLAQLIAELELARAAVVASVAALHHQNCEIDADIARVLQRRVGDVIGVQVEKSQQLLAALGGATR